MSFYYLNTTCTIQQVRQPVLLSHVARLKDKVPNDFLCCRRSAVLCRPLCANKSSERRDYKHFDDILILSFTSGRKAEPELENIGLSSEQFSSPWLI